MICEKWFIYSFVFYIHIIHIIIIIFVNLSTIEIFNNTDKQIRVVRYHSLVIDNLNFPPSLTIIANLENGTIMGLEHVKYPVFGIQFHPESIDTQFGKKIIKNFLEL